MTRKPCIPMRPADLPQQRLYLAKALPEQPASYDDNWGKWMDPSAMAVALRAGRPVDSAARLMLHDGWSQERDGGLDRFHWINENGLLGAGELAAVAAAVRGDAAGGSEEQLEADLQRRTADVPHCAQGSHREQFILLCGREVNGEQRPEPSRPSGPSDSNGS